VAPLVSLVFPRIMYKRRIAPVTVAVVGIGLTSKAMIDRWRNDELLPADVPTVPAPRRELLQSVWRASVNEGVPTTVQSLNADSATEMSAPAVAGSEAKRTPTSSAKRKRRVRLREARLALKRCLPEWTGSGPFRVDGVQSAADTSA
jgi:hypothetical protein